VGEGKEKEKGTLGRGRVEEGDMESSGGKGEKEEKELRAPESKRARVDENHLS
jgi:hypothetical protein